MAVKTIYLLRHAQTLGNLEKRYIGCKNDEPLCREGIDNVKSKRELLPQIPEDAEFISSPMKRCLETGKTLFEADKFKVIEELTEMDFGDFEGKNYYDLNGNEDYQRWIDSGGTIAFPNGEAREDFIERSLNGFMKAIEESRSDNLVIVCHGGNIMAIMSRLTGKEYFDFQVRCLEGYILTMNTGDESTDEVSYHSLFDRPNT